MSRLYEATHKQYNHTGYITPETEHSESEFPACEFKPAAWLPVVRQDTRSEEYTVIAAGKVVSLDRQGRVVPAGLKLSFEAAGGSTILTYTANDVSTGTTDLTTGSAVAAATSYTQTQVTTALRARGLIRATEYARDFITEPIGYARSNVWQWCGGDGWNPSQYRRHNHNMQHQITVGCDRVLQIPLVPLQQSAETMGDGSISSSAITFGTTQWHNSTGIAATTRYSSDVTAGDNVICYVFANTPVAKITSNTAITDSGSALASKIEVDSIAAVIAGGSGYFYIDYDAGVMFLYESGGDAVPSDFTDGTTTITYYHYESAAAGTQNITQVLGDVVAGDYLTFDSNSNYVKWTPDIGTASGAASGVAYSSDPDYDTSTDANISAQLEAFMSDSMSRVISQVVELRTWPRSGLEKVMTQYNNLTAYERMPGTATAGMTDALVQGSAANIMAIVNFLSR